MKRLSQQVREFQETVDVLQEAAERKDPESNISEVSRRNHVSEAIISNRILHSFESFD